MSNDFYDVKSFKYVHFVRKSSVILAASRVLYYTTCI